MRGDILFGKANIYSSVSSHRSVSVVLAARASVTLSKRPASATSLSFTRSHPLRFPAYRKTSRCPSPPMTNYTWCKRIAHLWHECSGIGAAVKRVSRYLMCFVTSSGCASRHSRVRFLLGGGCEAVRLHLWVAFLRGQLSSWHLKPAGLMPV